MNETARILCAINANGMYVTEFLAALGDDLNHTPSIFQMLNTLEGQDLIKTTRSGHNGIISLRLTPLGAERAREAMEGAN